MDRSGTGYTDGCLSLLMFIHEHGNHSVFLDFLVNIPF